MTAKYSKRLPHTKKFGGKVYRLCAVDYTLTQAEKRAEKIRDHGDFVRITSWPQNVSTEDYGEGPGFAPGYVLWCRKKR